MLDRCLDSEMMKLPRRMPKMQLLKKKPKKKLRLVHRLKQRRDWQLSRRPREKRKGKLRSEERKKSDSESNKRKRKDWLVSRRNKNVLWLNRLRLCVSKKSWNSSVKLSNS